MSEPRTAEVARQADQAVVRQAFVVAVGSGRRGRAAKTTEAAERLQFEDFNALSPALQRFLRRYRQAR